MTDGIIKGSGNSRYLRTVANARTLYPTWDAALSALVQGTFPIDLNGINSSGWSTVGTKLNKASLLTDSLCSALGLSTSATPTQAMDKLRQLVATAQDTANARPDLLMGSYVGTGVEGTEASPRSLTFSRAPKIVMMLTEAPFRRGNTAYDFFDVIGNNNTVINCAALSTEWKRGNTFGSERPNSVSDSQSHAPLGKKSSDGKTIYWYTEGSTYGSNNGSWCANKSGTTYYWIAFC